MRIKKGKDIQLAQLVDSTNPAAVFEEVKYNFIQHYSICEFSVVRFVFKDFNDLMDGRYPGYKGCNTKFHDKIHTTDALLAISRLIDGYNIKNPRLPVNKVIDALVATILHDAGYIQEITDNEGTGAKYTLKHVERSIVFMKEYFRKNGLKDFNSARNMVRCTGINVDLGKIKFSDKSEEILGKMLGTADLIGQMASRTYLEKLLFLYHEFKEGGVSGYVSEIDLLQKTLDFYRSIKTRLKKDFDDVYRYAQVHFQKRYHINKNLYFVAIDREISYLRKILVDDSENYRKRLRRMVEIVK